MDERAAEDWRRWRGVRVVNGYLVADPATAHVYPLIAATAKGRALHALTDANTDAAAVEFTKAWGFLHGRFEGGRSNRYPLSLFHGKRKLFLALARLSQTLRLRGDDREELTAAMGALQAARQAVDPLTPRTPIEQNDGQQRLIALLTPAEREALATGIPLSVLVQAVNDPRRKVIGLAEYAARTLADQLDPGLTRALRPVRHRIRTGVQMRSSWLLDDVPLMLSLEQALRWSLRTQFESVHHFFCADCGREMTSGRAGRHFCSTQCGTRSRVRRHRAEKRPSTSTRAARRFR